jgi:four helix bundle protein
MAIRDVNRTVKGEGGNVTGETIVPYRRAHKKLDVWQEGVALATLVYRVTEQFPKSEVYGLTSQMRRAVVSVPSNIAEGAARNSSKEFAQFLSIAGGSLSELDTQVEIAHNLNYLTDTQKQEVDIKVEFITGKLARLITSVRKKL